MKGDCSKLDLHMHAWPLSSWVYSTRCHPHTIMNGADRKCLLPSLQQHVLIDCEPNESVVVIQSFGFPAMSEHSKRPTSLRESIAAKPGSCPIGISIWV